MRSAWRLTAEQLQSRGNGVALRSADAAWSYAELAERAERLASKLHALGIRGGDRLGLLFGHRGHAEPVALAAALCSGAVVVPLDPAHPPARLRGIAEARRCRAVLHDAAAGSVVDALEVPWARLELDGRGNGTTQRGQIGVAGERAPEQACVLHTSGTTGVPKAVPIDWAGLDAFTEWMIDLTELGPGVRVLRVSELTFDLAWFDHVATWRAGATLTTIERRQLMAARAIASEIARLRPHVIYGVPSLFMKLLAGLAPDDGLHSELRVICFAGEVFPPRPLRELARRAPRARLINLFGPTETNVCTFHEVRREALDGQSELPIGIAPPYADCRLRPEDGTEGIIEGPGVGELEVAGPTALGGCCATGDRVERGADGQFYFRGRLDRMLKIHGYRVQPAEVEAALVADPRIDEAAVTVVDHPRLGPSLLGHVVLRHVQEPVSPRELRSAVAARLPSYMVPRRIERWPSLPRTSTGKIDYVALLKR